MSIFSFGSMRFTAAITVASGSDQARPCNCSRWPVSSAKRSVSSAVAFASDQRPVSVSASASRVPAIARHPIDPIDRARETLGWAPRVSLAEGLEKTIEYFRTLRPAELAVPASAARGTAGGTG